MQDLSTLTPEDVVTFQLRTRGFSLITKPGISLEADERARIASQTEAHFMLGRVAAPRPEYDIDEGRVFTEGPFTTPDWDAEATDDDYTEDDGIVYSSTIPCPACSMVHPC